MISDCDLFGTIRGWVLDTNKQQSSEGNGRIQQQREVVFLRTLTEVAEFVKIPGNVICKAMPQNIEKYHK